MAEMWRGGASPSWFDNLTMRASSITGAAETRSRSIPAVEMVVDLLGELVGYTGDGAEVGEGGAADGLG
jgi:hypothetical protein